MNTQQAKFILQGYRANGADAGDPTFAEALEQAKRDPELGQWLAREQASDRAICAKLAEVPAPAGLRESILAGGRMTSPDTTRRSWWQHPALMAAAASFAVLLAAGLALWPKQAVANSSLAEFALSDGNHGGGQGEETGALQAMLSQPTLRLGDQLPADFKVLRTTGCRAVNCEGHDILEVCFKRNGAWFHCYIAQRKDFPALAATAAPVLADRNGMSVASWADATNLYVVVSKKGHEALTKLL